MQKVLVTGCAGFVGSWICDKLLKSNYNVIGIDNLSSKINYTPNGVDFHNINLNSNISDLISDVDFVIHAAAHAELRHNWDDITQREDLFLNNEVATKSLLEQMPNVPIIFLSTAAVYGSMSNLMNGKILLEEDATPLSVESPYAASKLACESYVSAWSFKRKSPWYCLRLVNQVGYRTHRGVITDFCKMALQNNHIHASDNGKQKKNWVSVEDTANVVLKIVNSQNTIPYGIYNITSHERWSWLDIVKVMKDMYYEKHGTYDGIFKLSYEDKLVTTIGDPVSLHVSGQKLYSYYVCQKSVEKSVREALLFNGWTK